MAVLWLSFWSTLEPTYPNKSDMCFQAWTMLNHWKLCFLGFPKFEETSAPNVGYLSEEGLFESLAGSPCSHSSRGVCRQFLTADFKPPMESWSYAKRLTKVVCCCFFFPIDWLFGHKASSFDMFHVSWCFWFGARWFFTTRTGHDVSAGLRSQETRPHLADCRGMGFRKTLSQGHTIIKFVELGAIFLYFSAIGCQSDFIFFLPSGGC